MLTLNAFLSKRASRISTSAKCRYRALSRRPRDELIDSLRTTLQMLVFCLDRDSPMLMIAQKPDVNSRTLPPLPTLQLLMQSSFHSHADSDPLKPAITIYSVCMCYLAKTPRTANYLAHRTCA